MEGALSIRSSTVKLRPGFYISLQNVYYHNVVYLIIKVIKTKASGKRMKLTTYPDTSDKKVKFKT